MNNKILNAVSNIKMVPIQAINPEISASKPIVRNITKSIREQGVVEQHNYSRKILNKLERTPQQDTFVPSQAPSQSVASVDVKPKNRHNPRNIGDKQGMAEYFDNSAKVVDENSEQQKWLENVVAELDSKDAEKLAQKEAEIDSYREYALSKFEK